MTTIFYLDLLMQSPRQDGEDPSNCVQQLSDNSAWSQDEFRVIFKTMVMLRASRLIFIPLYFRCPSSMRFLIVFDMIDRIVTSLIPLDIAIFARAMPVAFVIDMFCNYSGDFWAQFMLLQIQVPLTGFLNGIAVKGDW